LLYKRYGGDSLDSHHAFIVSYKLGEDTDLGFHYDMSEVTVNVCLGKKFKGGQLYFKGLYDQPSTHEEEFIYDHVPGIALIHAGKHRHGALKIHSGERHNLIIWFKSSSYAHENHTCTCNHHHEEHHHEGKKDHHHEGAENHHHEGEEMNDEDL